MNYANKFLQNVLAWSFESTYLEIFYACVWAFDQNDFNNLKANFNEFQ